LWLIGLWTSRKVLDLDMDNYVFYDRVEGWLVVKPGGGWGVAIFS